MFRSARLSSSSRVDDLLAISLRSRATVIGPAVPIFFCRARAKLASVYTWKSSRASAALLSSPPFWRGRARIICSSCSAFARVWPGWQARDRRGGFPPPPFGRRATPQTREGASGHGAPSPPPEKESSAGKHPDGVRDATAGRPAPRCRNHTMVTPARQCDYRAFHMSPDGGAGRLRRALVGQGTAERSRAVEAWLAYAARHLSPCYSGRAAGALFRAAPLVPMLLLYRRAFAAKKEAASVGDLSRTRIAVRKSNFDPQWQICGMSHTFRQS